MINQTFFLCKLWLWWSHCHDQQDVVKQQYKWGGTQTKISSYFKHSLDNTKYAGYLKCFWDWYQNLHFMTSKFILWSAIQVSK
jgi:hypothetical protein